MTIDAINAMPIDDLRRALSRCCGSQRWVEAMIGRRPFATGRELVTAAGEIWRTLDPADWLEAFAAHPRIGDLAAVRERFGSTADLCGAEQAGVANAGEQVLLELADANRRYEDRFGHIFIVCASRKSAAEMLAILRSRIGNAPADELRVAAEEQWKITRLRLEKP